MDIVLYPNQFKEFKEFWGGLSDEEKKKFEIDLWKRWYGIDGNNLD